MFAALMHEPLSDTELRRYSRHLKLAEIGERGQARLKVARVALIGAGGLGSPAALYLAAAGVGTLGLVDYDSVDESNLQRQVLFDTASVGRPKTQVARARLEALNPGTRVVAHQIELCAANVRALFADYDLILDGSDRLGTRYLVNDACVLYGKSLVSAAIHRFEGQVMTYVPGRGPCYRCLFPTPAEGMVPNCADVGVLGVLPGVLGTIAATEVIKLIVGAGVPLTGRLLTYDALELRFNEFRFARRIDCAVCGDHPSITAPSDPPGFCTLEELRRVPLISPAELAQALTAPRQPIGLIDVRERDEFEFGHLPQAINIPLGDLEPRLSELPRDQTLVFMCRSGARSLKACALARRAGIEPLQLAGGLLAFKAAVDPSLAL
ncbi:MAG TPA: molybdopterin-synthase adenylyltransferase MoeB [Steroidobacteraceae bacterium]|jgi:molybdopterin/thiamine biosynthesis adenylyltransferase/rhodanese-related sulfurtransferase|nr:molybdopterin-synthase adenylyltransferase MoeB [Steroidobacteraceae bacterium]